MSDPKQDKSSSAFLPAVLAAWLAYLAIDFLIHAVLFASRWAASAAYWLPPWEIFRRSPFAYLSFLVYSAAILWLFLWLLGARPALYAKLRPGPWLGFSFGITTALGNYSIYAMPPAAISVWSVTVLPGALASAAAASAVFSAPLPWKRLQLVFIFALGIFILGVLLQNL